MEDCNCITLVKQFCESFLTSSQRKQISLSTLNKITKIVLSRLFTFRNDNIYCSELDDPYFLLRIEIHSRLLTSEYKNSITQVDNCLKYLEEIYETSDEKDDLNSLFLLIYKLSNTGSPGKSLRNEVNNIFQDDNDHVRLNRNIGFSIVDWNKFYSDPFSFKSVFNYPFFETPGTDIKFLKNYCPDFEPLYNNFSKIFEEKSKVWRFDLKQPVDSIAQDEGFVTPGSEFSIEEEINVYDSDSSSYSSDISVYDNQVLKLGKRTWEQLGKQESCSEVPFASEHLESVIYIWKIWNSNRNVEIKTLPLSSEITFEELKTDIRYLLFGTDSHSFYYNCLTKTFHIRDKLHLRTLTPEIVSNFCEPLMECASYYRSLKTFFEQRLNLPFGPIHRVFCRCINQVLNVYRYSLLNINWENVRFISQFDGLTSTLKRKLMFLVQFCLINMNEPLAGSNFPSGVQLLDYLYGNLMKVFKSDFAYILFHIFENCCNVYLKVVSEWMFDGCFSNPENYEEFFIEIQHEDEICRNWKRVSCIKVREKRVPTFLEKFYKEIFLCGKSVNLLKIFTTKDVLDTILQKTHPNIKCCFNKKQLDEYLLTWQQFEIDSDQQFNLRERIKKKLRKNFSADFYEQIKQFRANWFDQYEKNTRKISNILTVIPDKDVVSNNAVTSEINCPVFETVEIKSSDEILENHNAIDSEETNKNIIVCDPETNTKMKTKKLVEFYEKLNNSINEEKDQKSPKMIRTTPERIAKSIENEESTKETNMVLMKNEISELSNSTKSGSTDQNKVNEYEINETVKYVDVEREKIVQFGNYKHENNKPIKTKIDHKANIAKINEHRIDDLITSAKSSIPFVHDQTGAGDTISIATPISKPKSMLESIPGAGGDAFRSISTSQNVLTEKKTIETISEPNISVKVNEYERNKLKSAYSDQQNLLTSVVSCTKIEKKSEETAISDYARNKLKSISSDHQNQLNECNLQVEKKIQIETPMSVRDQNKIKIMSSEYHQRLMGSDKDADVKFSTETQNSREFTESEKNKFKVMSSEYHLRLLDLVEQEGRIQEKLISRNTDDLSERDLNKRKIMSSEYHNRLTVLSNAGKTDAEEVISDVENTFEQQSIRCTKNTRENDQEDTEESENSEDVESDDLITVLENENPKNIDGLNKQKTEKLNDVYIKKKSVFDLKKYVSYDKIAFPQVYNENTNNLKEAADSIKDVSRTSLFYYLSRSILIPLRIQSKIVNEAVLRVFIEEEGYLNHLVILRNYFLLRKPEFSLLLTNTIFEMTEKVKKPYLLLNNYTLSCILQQALLAGNSKDSLTFERKLSFVIEDTVPQVFDLTDINTLSCLSLNYPVKWPVNVLITEAVTKKYSRIFKFLMQIQRACWVLKNDFRNLKNLKQGKSIQYMQIQLYRHNMMQVMRILQEFLIRESLERCWNELVDYLTNSEISLDDLYMSHLKYVNKIMQRCFLCDASVSCHESIMNLLSSVLKYHVSLKSGTWQRNLRVNFIYHTNFKHIHAVFQEFRKYFNDVRSKLNILVYSKQRSYFEPLLRELSTKVVEETDI